MTTLGSDIYPTTTGGEVVSTFILIVGIGFVALLTGAFAQRFLGPEIAEVEAELEAEQLSAEAIALRELHNVREQLRGAGDRGRADGRPARAALSADLSPPRRRALGDLRLEFLHHVGVAQGRHVAQLAALGDVAQQAAHDLAGAGLGQVVGPDRPASAGRICRSARRRGADLLDQRRRSARCRRRSVTKAQIAWPVSSSDWPITAASATFGWETIADSTSAVESRWPETLTTSSIRPITQK